MAGTFALDISRFVNKAKVDTKTVVQKIAMEAFKRVILRSPVDTGRFRANWGCTIGSPYTGFDANATDKSGSTAIGKAQAVTATWNGQGVILLCNNASYALVLEYGRANGQPGSKQAPGGMVRLTVAEIQNWAKTVKP